MNAAIPGSKCYPWSNDGPLCPVLDNPAVWQRAFTDYFGIVKIVKQGCRTFGYQRAIRSYETSSFGEAARVLLNKPQGRHWLASTFKKRGAPGLHWWLFEVFYDATLRKTLSVTDFCHKSPDGHFIPDIELLRKWLKKRRYLQAEIPSLMGLFCVFAITRPDTASDILQALLDNDQHFESYLLVPEAEPVIAAAEDDIAGSEIENRVPDLDIVLPPPDVQATSPSPAPAFETMSNAIFFSEAGLNEGRLVLQRFLDNRSFSDNLTSPQSDGEVEREITDDGHSTTATDDGAADATLWISQLLRRLSTEKAENLESSPGTVASLFARSAQPNDTPTLLKKVCEDITASLDELIPTIAKRNQESLKALKEIHHIDDLLTREHFKCVCHVPASNLLDAVRCERELLDKLALSRQDETAVLKDRKRTSLEIIERLTDRLDFESLGPISADELATLESDLKNCEALEQLIPLRERCVQLSIELLKEPRGWKIPELVAEASQDLPLASATVRLARALLARGRDSEALAILTLLQVTTNRRASGIDDFSEFADVALLAAAGVRSDRFGWVDALWQQPWIRELSRHDIRQHQTWQRLAVAFLAQHQVRGSINETDLFYRLELQKVWGRDRLPALGQLLQAISTRKPVFVVTERATTGRDAIEERLRGLFRQNEHGEYLRQVGRTHDAFYPMERFHLFPTMEAIFEKIKAEISHSQWDHARATARQDPERLFQKTCKEAGIAADDSAFYKRQVLNPQQGYLALFFRDLDSWIDAAIRESGTLTEYILAGDVTAEVDFLGGQEPIFESFWDAVRDVFVGHPTGTQDVISADELVVELCRSFGNVALVAADFVVSLCAEGPRCKITSAVFDGVLAKLSRPPSGDDVLRLQTGQCYWHALLALKYIGQFQEIQALDLRDLENELNDQISQRRSRLTDRWTVLCEDPNTAPIDGQTFHDALEAGYFVYLDRVLGEAEQQHRSAAEKQRRQEEGWVQGQIRRIASIRDASMSVPQPNEWHEALHDLCSKLELILFAALRELRQGAVLSVPQSTMSDALDALSYIAEHGLHTFDEVRHHVEMLGSKPGAAAGTATATATKPGPVMIGVPEIAHAWNTLFRANKGDAHDVPSAWGNLVRHFCVACRLYYELFNTLQRTNTTASRWARYTTRFLNPHSSRLDRDVHLYLCFGNQASAEEVANLRTEFNANADSLNLVFVPNGYERLLREWSRSSEPAPYVLIPSNVLAEICAVAPGEHGRRHDVPLRQLLHWSAENLAGIGLFKSEGYVHQQKNLFVGRVRALQQLVQQPASVIWGGRRTGKTSLLHALQRKLQQVRTGPYKVALVYADTQAENPDLHFARDICRQLGLHVPGTLEEFSDVMHGACETHRIAVLMDEMDRYIIRSATAHGDDVYPLARELRGLSQSDSDQRFKLVYAGFKRLYYEVAIRHSDDPSYPFKNILEPITKDFRDFELGEVMELITLGFEEMLGVTWDVTVPRLITTNTSGHPAFVQRFCELLLARLSRGREQTRSQLHLTPELVHEVYTQSPIGNASDAFINYVFATLDYNVSALERALLLAVSTEILSTSAPERQSFSRHELIACLQQWTGDMPSPPSDDDIADALDMLTMTNMLTVEEIGGQQRYHVTYPAYIYFMRRLDELGKVEIFQSLQDYHEQERGRLLSGFRA